MKKFLAVLLCLFVLCSCTKGGSEKEKKVKHSSDETLYLTAYNFESTNPLDVKNNVNRDVFSLIYKSLFKTDQDGKPYPVLAERAICSSDNLSWEIVIKDNIFEVKNNKIPQYNREIIRIGGKYRNAYNFQIEDVSIEAIQALQKPLKKLYEYEQKYEEDEG